MRISKIGIDCLGEIGEGSPVQFLRKIPASLYVLEYMATDPKKLGDNEPHRAVRVALIDPEDSRLGILRAASQSTRFAWHLEHYSTAAQALTKFRLASPDVALVSVCLPDLPGFECARRLTRFAPSTSILMFATRADFRSVFRALAAGASGHIMKPASTADLVSAISRAILGLRVLCPLTQNIIVKGLQRVGRCTEHGLLSHREHEVIESLMERGSNKAIADDLNIAPDTVHLHMNHILKKLGVHDRGRAVVKYLGAD